MFRTMSEGGGNSLFIVGCGFAAFAIVFGIAIVLMFISLQEIDFEGMGESETQLDESLLTDEGQRYKKNNERKILETIHPIVSQSSFLFDSGASTRWIFYLAAILNQRVEKDDDKESCANYWIGPMKFKELNWSSKLFLNDFPDARTQFSDSCGDIKDERQEELKDIERLTKYQYSVRNRRAVEECEEQAKNERKELFCRSYGADGNQDEKADPFEEKDAILSAFILLRNYSGIYGDFGQALNQAYGENEKFLRAIKNQILQWVKDPSADGIFRWPLDTRVADNKVITKRYSESNGEVDLVIQSKDGEKVYAAASGHVVEVSSDPSCGEYVKLSHMINGGNISTIYCNLKDISVNKSDEVQIGQEIGKVNETSLTIRMSSAKSDENTDENQTSINPEEYLTAPNDVTFKEENNNSSEGEEKK